MKVQNRVLHDFSEEENKMKKFLKLFVVAALSAGMLISAVAISGCSDTPLISGDFSKEATSEQLDELDTYIGSSDSVYGDTAAEDWEYNARMLTRGDTDISVVQNATILNVVLNSTTNIKADYDSEQTLSFRNSENGPVLRGSGAVDYSYNLTETSGEDTEVQSINLSGYSYNDNDYFYLDGAASLNIGENSFSQTAKFKMPLEGAFSEIFLADQGPEGDEVFDLTMLAQLITQDGVEVYIDAQTTFKVKISLDVNAWLNSNAAFVSSLVGMDMSAEFQQLLDSINFGKCDYYIEFDKQTGELLGYGTDADVSFDFTFTVPEVLGTGEITVAYKMDVDSWLLKTEKVADPLPDDLSDYQELDQVS